MIPVTQYQWGHKDCAEVSLIQQSMLPSLPFLFHTCNSRLSSPHVKPVHLSLSRLVPLLTIISPLTGLLAHQAASICCLPQSPVVKGHHSAVPKQKGGRNQNEISDYS